MSDHLFEYALVTRDTVVTLDEPAPFSQIFEEPLAEWAEQLGQQGFSCRLELGAMTFPCGSTGPISGAFSTTLPPIS